MRGRGTRRAYFGYAGLVPVVAGCWLWAGASVGWCQGFMMQPMKVTLSARPGQEVSQVVKLENTTADHADSITVERVEIGQGADGAPEVAERKDVASSAAASSATQTTRAAGMTVAPARSCVSWLTVSPEAAEVAPQGAANLTIKVAVPANASGTYAAGVTAQTQPDSKAQGIAMSFRFLVPVVVEVQGAAARQQVDVVDAGFASVKPEDAASSKTVVTVSVSNAGESFPRLRPSVRILKQEGPHWRLVGTTDFAERGLLPAQTVTFSADPKRNFPSGRYQLVAAVAVDGRPSKTLTKEVDLVGDPNAGPIASDVELVMEPQRVACDVVPGGRRTAYVTLRNPTDEAVSVALGVAQVEALQGVILGDVKGDDYSAHAWVAPSPAEFQLAKGAQRKVAVQFAFPKDGLDKAAYYATLRLTATHDDGQPAGTMQALVLAENRKVTAEPVMHGEAMTLTQTEKNQYTVSATFANVGGVYVDPVCKGSLVAATARMGAKPFDMTREPSGLVLPLGTPRWNGTLDFSDVAPGGYMVKVTCEYAGKSVPQSFPVKVTDGEGGEKVVER